MDPNLAGRIDQAVARSLDAGQMSGCVVLIGRRAGIVFEKAYGNRCVEPEKESMTKDTLFDMASLTKPVATATSVMMLVERGQLRLRDNVSK
jgi:CubicO group peptidase (beta-lactamase class C family)